MKRSTAFVVIFACFIQSGLNETTDDDKDSSVRLINDAASSAKSLLRVFGSNFQPVVDVLAKGVIPEDPVFAAEFGELNENPEPEDEHANNFKANLLAASKVGEECRFHYNLTMEAIDNSEMWALSMFDAMGKLPSNLLGGNFKWMGNIDECEKVEAVVNGTTFFHGKYCYARIRLNMLPDAFKSLGASNTQLGVCASDRCSKDEVKVLLQEAFTSAEADIKVNSVVCHGPRELKSDAIAVIWILSLLGALVLVGTVYDILFIQLKLFTPRGYERLDEPPKYEASTDTVLVDKLGGQSTEKTPLIIESGFGSSKTTSLPNGHVPVPTTKVPAETNHGIVGRVLLSFSFYTNGCKLLSTAQGSETLGAVNGIRFLSMSWVILGHSYGSARSYAENAVEIVLTLYERFTFSAVAYATVSVDSFFVLSGLLVSYLTMKELKKVGGIRRFNWGMFYFHRFWRLTPPYMLVLMIGTVLTPYFSVGAFGIAPDLDTHPNAKWCRDNWWTNLLYVNNYVNNKEKCMGHAWYLANDMQFYIISPLLMIPLFYNVIAGGIVCLAFMIATVTTNLVIVSEHEYPVQSGVGVPPAKDKDYFNNIYAASYARMGPYIVGLLTGYILYRVKCKCRIPLWLNLLLWFACFTICCLCVYGPYTDGGKHIFSNLDSTMYFAFARTGWGLAVAWIVFACATGNGGWINQLLSWGAFIPLGRLSYLAYLIHPYIQVLYFEIRTQAVYISNIDMIYIFLGHMCLTYGLSYVLSLVFEAPMMGLEKALLRRNK